jgi:hypothetical protein
MRIAWRYYVISYTGIVFVVYNICRYCLYKYKYVKAPFLNVNNMFVALQQTKKKSKD